MAIPTPEPSIKPRPAADAAACPALAPVVVDTCPRVCTASLDEMYEISGNEASSATDLNGRLSEKLRRLFISRRRRTPFRLSKALSRPLRGPFRVTITATVSSALCAFAFNCGEVLVRGE